MSKDPAKLEKALAKQARRDARKEKDKARKNMVQTIASGEPNISQAGAWALHQCWVSEDWQNPRAMNQLVVTRQSAGGQIAAGVFVIDLGCLGVKDAFARGFADIYEFEAELFDSIQSMQTMQPCTLDFAAKMVQTTIAYARGLGFEPHKDARKPLRLLGTDAHPENCPDTIPTGGEDGKPFYANGPYDNMQKILSTLNRNVGEGNYTFMLMGEDFDELEALFEDDLDDDALEDDALEDGKTIDVVAKS